MWDKFIVSFHANETIIWARIQLFVGAVWATLAATDLSPVLHGKYLTYWLIVSGVITELLRRNRATDLT